VEAGGTGSVGAVRAIGSGGRQVAEAGFSPIMKMGKALGRSKKCSRGELGKALPGVCSFEAFPISDFKLRPSRYKAYNRSVSPAQFQICYSATLRR
jgi:hypothetical protein